VLRLERKGNRLELKKIFEIACFLDAEGLVFKAINKWSALAMFLSLWICKTSSGSTKILGNSCFKQEGTLTWVYLWAVEVLIKVRDGKL
jgi:hypothetical protein